jgi:hypothetical protein
LINFMAIRYSLWSFGIFFLFWYIWTKNNLASLDLHIHVEWEYVHATVLQLKYPLT